MNIAIVEDELPAAEKLTRYLKKYNDDVAVLQLRNEGSKGGNQEILQKFKIFQTTTEIRETGQISEIRAREIPLSASLPGGI